jgi:hypothetical protein
VAYELGKGAIDMRSDALLVQVLSARARIVKEQGNEYNALKGDQGRGKASRHAGFLTARPRLQRRCRGGGQR